MIDRVRGCWSAVLRWFKVRPPQGHMEMLRGVVSRREHDRVAQAAAAGNRGRDDATASRGNAAAADDDLRD
jgi:hypothetical protein